MILFLSNLLKNSIYRVFVICKLAMAWYITRMCASWPNLVPRAQVSWSASRHGVWNNQILGVPVSRGMRALVYNMASRDKVNVDAFHKGIQCALPKPGESNFVFPSLVGVPCAIFVWNSRSPVLACSDLFTGNFISGSLRISLRAQTYWLIVCSGDENKSQPRSQGLPSYRTGGSQGLSSYRPGGRIRDPGNEVEQELVNRKTFCWVRDIFRKKKEQGDFHRLVQASTTFSWMEGNEWRVVYKVELSTLFGCHWWQAHCNVVSV